jgi:retron-type reverse transcriptase
MAWQRVRGNQGSRSAGVDGQTAYHVEQVLGVEGFLDGLREQLRLGSYRTVAVRERMIPKRGGKRRRLGITTLADRVVQAALKTVLEPIFEVDFQPCSLSVLVFRVKSVIGVGRERGWWCGSGARGRPALSQSSFRGRSGAAT